MPTPTSRMRRQGQATPTQRSTRFRARRMGPSLRLSLSATTTQGLDARRMAKGSENESGDRAVMLAESTRIRAQFVGPV